MVGYAQRDQSAVGIHGAAPERLRRLMCLERSSSGLASITAKYAMAGFMLHRLEPLRPAQPVLRGEGNAFNVFACGGNDQAAVWLLRRRASAPDGRVRADVNRVAPAVAVLRLVDERYRLTGWQTEDGRMVNDLETVSGNGRLAFAPSPVGPDRASAIRRT